MVPINTLPKTSKRRKQRIYAIVVCVVFLSVVSGSLLYWRPPSLQGIGTKITSFVGKITRTSAGESPAEPVLRGTIYDRSLKELAVTYRLHTLTVSPPEIKDRDKTAAMLAGIFGQEKADIEAALKSRQRVITLADDLDSRQAEAIKGMNKAGVYCTASDIRFYPAHTSGAQILGFVEDGVGLYGVEGTYDAVLQSGEFKESAAGGIDFREEEVLGRSTTDIILTLDMEFQRLLDKRLRQYLKEQDAAKAMGMLIEPFTGKILATMSLPAFNPNYYWKAGEQYRADMVYRHQLEKELVQPLLTRAAAIDRDGPTRGKMIPTTVASPDYGVDKQELAFFDYKLRLFEPVFEAWGIGKVQGVGPGGKKVGRRGNTLTGAQVTTALASLMNGGWRIAPHVLYGIYDHATDAVYVRGKGEGKKQHILEPASGIVLRRELFSDQGREKGKKAISVLRRYRDVRYGDGVSRYVMQELYIGMAPANMPKYLLVMAVDKERLDPAPYLPREKRSSLPEIGEAVLAGVVDSGEHVIAAGPQGRSKENFKRFLISKRLDYQEEEQDSVTAPMEMPELTGLSLRKALQRLNQYQIRLRIQGTGTIVAQVPEPGKPLGVGRECVLTLESEI